MKVLRLTGSSWDHPRGHAPMLATATGYEALRPGTISIEWTPRTLKEFGMVSVEELARQFDLIVMDHPHIGTMAESGCVVPFDEWLSPSDLARLSANSPGRSHESYQYGGHQWGLAIDAACQTSATRRDLVEAVPTTWAEVIDLAASGRVLWPLGPVDAAASFLTLAASAGAPCATREDRFVDRDVALGALETMRQVAVASDPRCLEDNPIDVLEALAHSDEFAYSPLLFCYLNYSRVGHSGAQVAFGDIPTFIAGGAPVGSLLGGAGLAVSATSAAVREAVEYALYVASPEVQSGIYVESGGQPAHRQAWSDPALDRASGGFFSGVGPTLRGSWTRPNGPRFAHFQNTMIDLFAEWFSAAPEPDDFLNKLDALYLESVGASESKPS